MLVADAPSVTDWMQGWGSVLSLAVSTGALVFTGWLLRHEIRVRREEKADADAAQARLVVAHVVGMEMSRTDRDTGRQVGPMVAVQWRVKNHSQAPTFDLFVSINGWEDNRWGEVIEDEASGTVECNPPLPFDSGPFDPREALVKVEFTDAAGLRWTRRMGKPLNGSSPCRPSTPVLTDGFLRSDRRWPTTRSPSSAPWQGGSRR